MKYLIVVDFQNDFVTGPLGNPECRAAAESFIADKSTLADENTVVIYTKDTHFDNYLKTIEGQKLPIPHCIKGTEGWNLVPGVKYESFNTLPELLATYGVIEKNTFGSLDLPNAIEAAELIHPDYIPSSFTIVGVCTDICVISNAMLLKAAYPNVPIYVNSKYCAGVTPESHQNALNAMKMCHIEII